MFTESIAWSNFKWNNIIQKNRLKWFWQLANEIKKEKIHTLQTANEGKGTKDKEKIKD